MVESLGQATHKLLHKQGQNYLKFYFARYIYCFYCESSLQYGDGKKSKTSKIYGRNPKSGLERGLHSPHKIYSRFLL